MKSRGNRQRSDGKCHALILVSSLVVPVPIREKKGKDSIAAKSFGGLVIATHQWIIPLATSSRSMMK